MSGYDSLGRLANDQDPVGGFSQLSRTGSGGTYRVALTTALARTTAYSVQQLAGGSQVRVNTYSPGIQETSLIAQDGSTTKTTPDGSVSSFVTAPDPRFGITAPLPASGQLTTPSGLTASFTRTSSVTLTDPTQPLSLRAAQETLVLNGHIQTRLFDKATNTLTFITPAGRQYGATFDAQGHPAVLQAAGLDPIIVSRDANGRPIGLAQGAGGNQRTLTIGYDAAGFANRISDPVSRSMVLLRDGAGRPLKQSLSWGSTLAVGYDANGDTTSLTPPGEGAHGFSYSAVDDLLTYVPPAVAGAGATTYSYNQDRQLIGIAKPDGQAVALSYDSGGRLSTVSSPAGQITYAYQPGTGNLLGAASSAGESLGYAYDGFLLTQTSWSGTVAGSVQRSYNRDFRVSSVLVDGANPIGFQYDPDGPLTQAGAEGIAVDPTSGLPVESVLGQVVTTVTYNTFGEVASFTANAGTSALLSLQYSRDNLGRIVHKVESVGGSGDAYDYGYDGAGRLTTVAKNGTTVAQYSYDANGNRTQAVEGSSTSMASYDAQERLTHELHHLCEQRLAHVHASPRVGLTREHRKSAAQHGASRWLVRGASLWPVPRFRAWNSNRGHPYEAASTSECRLCGR